MITMKGELDDLKVCFDTYGYFLKGLNPKRAPDRFLQEAYLLQTV